MRTFGKSWDALLPPARHPAVDADLGAVKRRRHLPKGLPLPEQHQRPIALPRPRLPRVDCGVLQLGTLLGGQGERRDGNLLARSAAYTLQLTLTIYSGPRDSSHGAPE